MYTRKQKHVISLIFKKNEDIKCIPRGYEDNYVHTLKAN